jgi:hypothetical protein
MHTRMLSLAAAVIFAAAPALAQEDHSAHHPAPAAASAPAPADQAKAHGHCADMKKMSAEDMKKMSADDMKKMHEMCDEHMAKHHAHGHKTTPPATDASKK